MPSISWDDKAFIVGGRKIWIASGAIHYFRVPRELWRDRLIKLKRAGLNTVETYIAWNAHEPREGQFDFSGMLDLDAFLSLARDLGLWVIVRPGPYICSEWDNGGLPAWLNAKPGVKLRVANGVYHHYLKLWFKKLIPIIAKHQVSCGGRVILVQDENEYIFRNRPGGRDHLIFIRDLLRQLGIEVPIIVCNFLYERIPDTIECWNCWDEPDAGIENLRKAQPGTPKLIAEFWCGWFDGWGHKPEYVRSPREVHANTMRVLAHGGMYSYYMFHGGTNFGFFPGRTVGDDANYIVSSYDSGALLGETGVLGEKYYSGKLASTFATNLADFLADSEPDDLKVVSSDDVRIVTRRGPQGHVIFVFKRAARAKSARLILPGAVSLDVSFADVDALALPWRFCPVPGFSIDYSNLSLLGAAPMGVGRLVFLYGPSGTTAVLGAQGRVFRRKVGDGTQVWFGNFPNLVAILDTRRAERTWFLEDRTVVGAAFVGETDGEKTSVSCRGESDSVIVYFPNGRVSYVPCASPPKAPRPPALSRWKKRSVLPGARPDGARRIDDHAGGFKPLESTDYFGGYGWYHTVIESDGPRTEKLLFTDAEDRLTVFVNGRRCGTFGRGKGASMGLLSLPIEKGANRVFVLLDNLGRANYSEAVGEIKGIRAPVYLGARSLAARREWTASRYDGKLANTWQMESFWPDLKGIASTLSVLFERKPDEGVVFRIRNVHKPAAIFLNRQFHSYFWGSRDLSKLDLTIPADSLARGRNLVELGFFADPGRGAARAVSLYAYSEAKRVEGPWWFWPLEAPTAPRGVAANSAPAVLETSFKLENPVAPVFLVTEGLRKGEIWLNGRMVSRHWDIGPQKKAYLPEPWLVGTNTLAILDEFGASPAKVRLEYDPRGIMRNEVVG